MLGGHRVPPEVSLVVNWCQQGKAALPSPLVWFPAPLPQPRRGCCATTELAVASSQGRGQDPRARS